MADNNTPRLRLVNRTPHALNILGGVGGVMLPPPPRGTPIPRVAPPLGSLDLDAVKDLGIPVTCQAASGGTVIDLPSPQDGVLIVVSLAVRAARPDRTDLVSPGPGFASGRRS